MNRDVFNFTPDFENLVLASYIHHPDKFLCRGHLIAPEYFSSVVSVITMRCISKYQQQYTRVPAWETLTQLVEDEVTRIGGDNKSAADYIQRLRKTDPSDSDFVVDRIVLFCRERATINAVKKVASSLRDGKLPEENVLQLFESALRIGENIDDFGYLLHESVDTVIDKVMSPEFGVRTGFPQFDLIWKTGWAPGWLIVLLAPPKRYKTTSCINFALNVAGPSVAEDVIYYACEISQEQAVVKSLCNIAGLRQSTMFDSIEHFKEHAKQAVINKISANLLIKHFPIGTASVGDLKSHARMAKKQLGINPRMIIIDYADSLRPSNPSDPPHMQQASIYKEAIAMGKELGCCVVMPDRCNAETVGLRVPNMKSFQGAFAKGGIVDIAIGLCSTDVEYYKNILRWFVFFNRHGEANQHFKGLVDPDMSKIEIGEQIPYDPEEDNQQVSNTRKRKTSSSTPDFNQDDLA